MGVNSLPKTVTRHRRGCDLNPGPTAPESTRRLSDILTRVMGQYVRSGVSPAVSFDYNFVDQTTLN